MNVNKSRKRIFIVTTFVSYVVFVAAAIVEMASTGHLSWPVITALLAMAGKDAANYSFSRTKAGNSDEYGQTGL
jgi:uncharacterized membrane protein YccC